MNPLAIGELGGSLVLVATPLREGPRQWLINLARVAAVASSGLLALQSGSPGQLIFSIGLALFLVPVSKQVKNVFQFIATLSLVLISIPAIRWIANTFLGADVLDRWSGLDVEGGIAVRLQNWADLLAAWIRAPGDWLQGLGFNAFSVVTTAGSKEEYPHDMFVEIFAEEGLLMFGLLLVILTKTFRDAWWLFRRFAESATERVTVSALIALATYYFVIANKQANLWGNGMMLMFLCVISRLRLRTEDQDALDAFTDAPDLPVPGLATESDPKVDPVLAGATR